MAINFSRLERLCQSNLSFTHSRALLIEIYSRLERLRRSKLDQSILTGINVELIIHSLSCSYNQHLQSIRTTASMEIQSVDLNWDKRRTYHSLALMPL